MNRVPSVVCYAAIAALVLFLGVNQLPAQAPTPTPQAQAQTPAPRLQRRNQRKKSGIHLLRSPLHRCRRA